MNRIAIMVTVIVALLMAGMVTYDATAEATPVTYQTERTASAAAVAAHQSITNYAGPQTCVACHLTEAKSAHKSMHYQESGPTPYVPNIPGIAGKNKNAMNTYCGAISTSSYFTCSGCHISNGQRPTSKATPAQLANVDCMMCHATTYARKAAPPYTQVSAVAQDGSSRMLNVPVETASGFHFMVNEAAMGGVTALDAARNVGPTTRGTCLRCHATAGGGDGTKRGDLSSLSAAPTVQQDMHMSPDAGGKNLTCAACHNAGNHKMTGRGLDLRENDVNEQLTCAKCHSDRPHGDYNARDGESMDAHASRVACQTCHIPTFAKGKDTEMERDWTVPVWFTGAFGGQGGWKPEEIRASDVTPSYRWFDGRSNIYNLGQRATKNAAGEYQFGVPLGSVSSSGAKIYPMKEHTSIAARQISSGKIIPHSTEVYFRTGDFTAAVVEGMARAKMTGAYEIVPLHTFQTINHGVEPEENALECAACHADMSGGGGDDDDDDRAATATRMDLTGELGYQLKGPQTTVCTQCHGRETYEGFLDTHDKHVKDKGYDCSYCHTFSRPERGLKLPRP